MAGGEREARFVAFDKPAVVDYGTLTDLTASTTECGDEDGAGKNETLHHSDPCQP